MSKATRVRIIEAGDSIRRRETFVAGDGSLTGRHEQYGVPERGRLAETSALTHFARARGIHQGALYVVRSYGTPIAWAGPGELLTVPDVRYSVTTGRHQNIARRADYSDGLCHGESPAGHGDPRCGRKGGHIDVCDWTD